jgi:hypothetical protein
VWMIAVGSDLRIVPHQMNGVKLQTDGGMSERLFNWSDSLGLTQ